MIVIIRTLPVLTITCRTYCVFKRLVSQHGGCWWPAPIWRRGIYNRYDNRYLICSYHKDIECCHSAYLFVTDGTAECHNGNPCYHQWRQSWHHGHSWSSLSIPFSSATYAMRQAYIESTSEDNYRHISNISRTLFGSKLVDHSVGVAPTTSSFFKVTPGFNELGKDNSKTRRGSFKFLIWCVLY